MTQVDLVTGILGSGKTTFIKEYVKYLISKGEKIAILENDFGAVNVDMVMLQDLKSDNCQIEMVSGGGDACCHKRRFKTQMISLGMQKFDRVIIEPSGIFDMDEFFDTLYESPLDRWFKISNIFNIIDSQTENNLPPHMEYLFASEASCSGKLILSKISGFESNDDLENRKKEILDYLNKSLQKINCNRSFKADDIFSKEWSILKNEDFELLLKSGYRSESYVKLYSIEDIKSSVHYFMHIRIADMYLTGIINDIIKSGKYGKIYRIKGSAKNDAGKWIRVNATPEKIDIEEIEKGQSVFIVIGDDIDKAKIDDVFMKYNTDKEYVSI